MHESLEINLADSSSCNSTIVAAPAKPFFVVVGARSPPSTFENAKKMGKQGREWVIDHWRKEDMVAYYFRLWLEYARVMSPERKSMNFSLSK